MEKSANTELGKMKTDAEDGAEISPVKPLKVINRNVLFNTCGRSEIDVEEQGIRKYTEALQLKEEIAEKQREFDIFDEEHGGIVK